MTSPWPSADSWILPLFFAALGAVLLILGFMLLAEYRRLFFSNPRAAMSIDVLGHLLDLGAPGYLGLCGLGFGAFFLGIGVFIATAMVVYPISEIVRQVLHALTLNF